MSMGTTRISVGIASTLFGSALIVAIASAQSPAPAKVLMAEDVFKNVQALKGIPADDFMATMGLMSAALGFDCDSCHERAGTDNVAWEKDTPNKVMARKMVLMVQAINKDNFRGRQMVTCFTCHRNRDIPLVTPNLDDWYGETVQTLDDVVAPATGGPTVDQILGKYMQALGGEQKARALTSFVAQGSGSGFGGFGGNTRVELMAQFPDKRATYITYPDDPKRGDSTRTFDGHTGWLTTPLAVVHKYELTGSELDGAKVDAELSFPYQIKTALTNLHVGPVATIKDQDVQILQGTGPRGMIVTLYFDKTSGLLTRTVRYGRSPIGRLPTQIDYADYRDVNGLRLPFRLTFSWLDGRDTFQLTSIDVNAKIDPAKFGEPKATQQSGK
ncbi:MAG TPA: photosynthetic reaction center cytochrome c subunit family protein [Vicinamibacterales bacterium]|nr:photosynthetic reaction center cytochrome c subunit family protein [Vicinamibacterales bacterium]